MEFSSLSQILILIASAVFVVMAFKKVNLSPVLGYLCAGILIGDHGLKIVSSSQISFIADFGVVFLLFTIGLELSFERLKDMRKYVFGLGSLQIIVTFSVFFLITILFNMDYRQSIVLVGGICLSSTAVVLQVIRDLQKQSTQLGRISLSILLQQDFVVIPLIIVIPLLANSQGNNESILFLILISIIKALVVLLVIFIIGRLMLRPLFKFIFSINPNNDNNEIFIATVLLVVLSAAWSTYYFGLSLALGAFVAGVLVAETEFRHQAEESIAPFKDLLLGLFFMFVGMKIDVSYLYKQIWYILIFTLCVVLIKSIILTILCRFFGLNKGLSTQIGLILAQGSEFSFILCKLATTHNLISSEWVETMLVVVTLSMAITPMLSILGAYINKKFNYDELTSAQMIRSSTKDLANHVIMLGFSRASKMAAKIFTHHDIKYVIIERNEEYVKKASNKGLSICHGNYDMDTLELAGIKICKGILIFNENFMMNKIITDAYNNFPKITIAVYTNNFYNIKKLYHAGATVVVSMLDEAGMELSSIFLREEGYSPIEISKMKNLYRNHNYELNSK